MSTILLATESNAATSSEFTLAAGEVANLFLINNDGPGTPFTSIVNVEIKETSGSQFFSVGSLDWSSRACNISGPGTFRIRRPAQPNAVGVARA